MQTIESSRLKWNLMPPDEGDDYVMSYCADDDGMVQVIDYGDQGVVIVDQLEPVAEFMRVDTYDDVRVILEHAQAYLAATYNDLFQQLSAGK